MSTSILFVEDNEDLRENAALVLGLEGYVVKVARDGREALDILESGFSPNLIVSDIMMPRMDGYQFFEAVREKAHLKAIPFIFLTARGSRQDITTGRLLGADDYLVKPFDPEEFLIAVQNKLQRVAEIGAQATETLNNARRALVQLLSHELRTPLTYVTGGFALLAEELETRQNSPTTDDIRVSLELIQSGTQRLNRLAEQMVLYSEIISGFMLQQVQVASEYLDATSLCNDAISLLHIVSQEQATHIHLSFPNELVTVHGVRGLLVTALSEVSRKAIQYAGLSHTLEVVVDHDDEWAIFTVIDQGPGIRPEDQHEVWDVLIQSGRERNEQQGVGMGLPIVKGIIEAHNGDVDLYSVVDKGTEVTLRLPLAEMPD